MEDRNTPHEGRFTRPSARGAAADRLRCESRKPVLSRQISRKSAASWRHRARRLDRQGPPTYVHAYAFFRYQARRHSSTLPCGLRLSNPALKISRRVACATPFVRRLIKHSEPRKFRGVQALGTFADCSRVSRRPTVTIFPGRQDLHHLWPHPINCSPPLPGAARLRSHHRRLSFSSRP